MSSARKLDANRLTGQKSAGPSATEGKSRSAKDAFKHFLPAEQFVLPNEDPAAYEALRQEWLDAYPDADIAQLTLIELAVSSTWKLKRAARYERAMIAYHMRHAEDDFDREEQARAEELGRRLFRDPLKRS
jgi:hypothetical protein